MWNLLQPTRIMGLTAPTAREAQPLLVRRPARTRLPFGSAGAGVLGVDPPVRAEGGGGDDDAVRSGVAVSGRGDNGERRRSEPVRFGRSTWPGSSVEVVTGRRQVREM